MRPGANALIIVRPIHEADREPIRRLLIATNVFTDEEIGVALELVDIVLNNATQKDYLIYTGLDEANLVAGYYCIGPTPMTDGTYDLYWIAVSPVVQNKGIGKQLLNDAEQRVAGNGGRLIIAETSSQPKYESTRMFYLKNAYSEIARIKEYYRPGDDLVVYGKYVSLSGS